LGHALGSDFSIGVQVQLTSRNSLTRLLIRKRCNEA